MMICRHFCIHLKMDQFTINYLFIIISLSSLNICTAISTKAEHSIPQVPYAEHCNDVVPESPATRSSSIGNKFLQVYSVYFSGINQIHDQNSRQFGGLQLRSVSFDSRSVHETESVGVLELTGVVTFQGLRNSDFLRNSTSRRRLRKIHIRPPKIPLRLGRTSFNLRGFWSSYSGNLCMVGKANGSPINVVLKFNYPNSTTIFTSLVNGTLQSLNPQNDPYYFQSISILGVSVMNYEYTLINRDEFNSYDYMLEKSLNLDSTKSICSVFRSAGRYELQYLDDCNATNCNPLGRNDNRSLPRFMSVNEIKCSSDGKVRYLLEFSNSSFNGIRLPFDPKITLVAEGAWDRTKKRLALVACRIKPAMNGLVHDCSIRLSFSLPSILSLRNRSSIVGQLWSNGSDFGIVSFRSSANVKKKLNGMNYEYTVIDRAMSSCKVKGRTGNYPNGYSSDMRFDMTVKDRKGKLAWGYTSPFYVGRKFYRPDGISSSLSENEKFLNISYEMTFTPPPGFLIDVTPTFPIQISAEGVYNIETGFLCLIGCRNVMGMSLNLLDCEILINLQYPPLDSKSGSFVKGIIESTRLNSDSLHFERLEVVSNSIYVSQARDSIWRMDLEITMVLASNTLACIFVGLQLRYSNKKKDSLPRISIVMLTILMLAHMIPLVLNFEALFVENRNRQNMFLDNGKWVEVNEVLVRLITMVAFLLQFRLLQLAWSARVKDENRKSLWLSDMKVFFFFIPLYIGFGFLAWWKKLYQTQSLLGYVKSYSGLVLDGFLLPQIVFNVFSNSRDESALAISFYVGTTMARLLPHVYDLCRSHGSSSAWYFNDMFANRGTDYFSTMWDIVITVFGLLFIVIVYLQQRFGGRCVLPLRFRGVSEYVKVPTISVELSS